MSISKPFYQHIGTLYRRSKSFLIVWISSETVAENCSQVWLQFAMTTCVLPLRQLAMLWHARGPEASTLDSWLARKTRAVLIAVLLKPYWHPEFRSLFINKHSLFRQTEAVIHCQIQQQTNTCCNAELSLSNHGYIATWTLDGKISAGFEIKGSREENAPKLSPNAPRLLNLGAKFCYPIQPDICIEAEELAPVIHFCSMISKVP